MSNMKRILIVEDETTLSDAYEMILESGGYAVEVANDGGEALDKADIFKPNLILLDLRMPHIGGIEFLKRYKAQGEHEDVKILVFSNLDTQSEIDDAHRLGADRYILKAWASPKDLLQLVADTLKSPSHVRP